MSQFKFLVIAISLLGCTSRTLKMEFEAVGKGDARYKLYDDASYSLIVNNIISETGKVRTSGDTLFLLKNVEYNITINPEILFLIDKDSICRLELQIEQTLQGFEDLEQDFKIDELYKYSKKECGFLKVINNPVGT